MSAAVVQFYDDKHGQYRTGLLAKSGDKYAHLVVYEPTGLRATRVAVEDEAEFVYYPIPPSEAVRKYRELAARAGITEGARELLDHASKEVQS